MVSARKARGANKPFSSKGQTAVALKQNRPRVKMLLCHGIVDSRWIWTTGDPVYFTQFSVTENQRRIEWLKAYNAELVALGVRYKTIVGLDTLLVEAHYAKEYGLKLVPWFPFSHAYRQAGDAQPAHLPRQSIASMSRDYWALAEGLLLHPEVMEVLDGIWIADDVSNDSYAFGENGIVDPLPPSHLRSVLKRFFPNLWITVSSTTNTSHTYPDTLTPQASPHLDAVIGQNYHWESWRYDENGVQVGNDDFMCSNEDARKRTVVTIRALRAMQRRPRENQSMVRGGLFAQTYGYHGTLLADGRLPVLIPKTPPGSERLITYPVLPPEGEVHCQLAESYRAGLQGYYGLFNGIWDLDNLKYSPDPALRPPGIGELDRPPFCGIWDAEVLKSHYKDTGKFRFDLARTYVWQDIRRFVTEMDAGLLPFNVPDWPD